MFEDIPNDGIPENATADSYWFLDASSAYRIASVLSAFGGIFFSLISAGLFYFHSKIIAGGIVLGLGIFVLSGFLADATLCRLLDMEIAFKDPSVLYCRMQDYAIPATLLGIGAVLVFLGLWKR